MCLQSLEAVAGKNVSEIRVYGDAMTSSLWSQILADVTKKKVLLPEVKDAAALGAAMLVFRNSKRYGSLEDAITNMVRFNDVKEPIKGNARVYKKLYKIFLGEIPNLDSNKRVTRDL